MLWTGTKDGKGYGALRLDSGRRIGAHRFSCFLANGQPGTPRLQAAHGCRNVDCVAPGHLRWATRKSNEADKLRDGTRPLGEKSHLAKLTPEQVLEIFASTDPMTATARRFGVSVTQVWYIRDRRSWAHLTEGLVPGVLRHHRKGVRGNWAARKMGA